MPYGKAGASRAFGSPGKYIQGPGEIHSLAALSKPYGKNALILIDNFFYKEFKVQLAEDFAQEGQTAVCVSFAGECCDAEIQRVCDLADGRSIGMFIGIGGGKTCDVIKSVAHRYSCPVIVCPTALSTDAPTSTHSVVYREDHSYYLDVHRCNPDFVLVDTEIAVKAPARMFAAGMGDALATYFEARACAESDNINNVGKGYRRTQAGMAIARLSYDVLMEKGRAAYLAARTHIRTEAFEDVAEANTLLSGVGFENTGCSISHGIQASLAVLHETAKLLHGEQVAFGVLCQLVVENRPSSEFKKIYDFCKDIGLPTNLSQLGITENVEATVKKVADYGIANKAILKIEPFEVTADMLFNAMMFVDAYSKENN